MNHYTGQTHSHTDELQLAVLTQENKRLQHDILSFEAKHYQHQDELNLFLNVAKQLKYHCFAAQQQPLLSLPDRASQVLRTVFVLYLIEIYGAQLTKGLILFICGALTNTYISLIYDTLFNPLSDILFEFLNGIWSEIQPLDRTGVFRKSSIEFLKRLASTLNTAAQQSRRESKHKIARQEIYISSLKDADLQAKEILDSLTLLSWYIHRFWKSLVRHIFPATKLIAEAYPQLISKLPETSHYIYDLIWFPQNFVSGSHIIWFPNNFVSQKYCRKLYKNYPLTIIILK